MDIKNEYGMLDTQKYYLPILDYIDQLCRSKGIKYTISDGSLIGAIRHSGFIPWDDDIDISFDRENFNRFIEAVKEDCNSEYILIRDLWVTRITRKDNPLKNLPIPQRCIDLFIFDNVPDNVFKNKIKNFLIKTLQGMIKEQVHYDEFPLIIKLELFATHIFGKLFTKKRKQKWYDCVCQWGNKCKCNQSARYYCSFRYISNVRYPSNITSKYTEVEFENKKYMAVENWDLFLTTDYGDYMQLPPENKRRPKHQ